MNHPSPDNLRDFVLGTLDEAGEREVREHLAAGCDACQATLHEEAATDHALWETRQADRAAELAAGAPALVVPLSSARRAPMWLMGGGLAAAASALVVVGLWWTAGAEEPPMTSVAPAAAPAAAPAPPAATPPLAPPAEPAAVEPAAVEPAAVEPAAVEPAAEPAAAAEKPATPEPAALPVPPASARASKPAAKPTTRRPKVSSAPKPPPPARKRSPGDCDPILDMDCAEKGGGGGSAKKASLSPSDVLAVVRKNLGSIQACGTTHDVQGTVRMEWRILKSGRTSSVKVLSEAYQSHPVGRCMTAAIKKWRFPAFNSSPPPPVKFPFKLKG